MRISKDSPWRFWYGCSVTGRCWAKVGGWWATSQPGTTFSSLDSLCPALSPPSQTTVHSPRSFFLNACPAYASKGCSLSWLSNTGLGDPRAGSRSSCTPCWVPSTDISEQFFLQLYQGIEHFLFFELLISLMMWASCQLLSNLNRSSVDWLFFPLGLKVVVKCFFLLLKKRLRILVYSL